MLDTKSQNSRLLLEDVEEEASVVSNPEGKRKSRKLSMKSFMRRRTSLNSSSHSVSTFSDSDDSIFSLQECGAPHGLRSCLKGSRLNYSTTSNSAKKLKVHFHNSLFRSKSPQPDMIHVVPAVAFEYKAEMFWTKKEERSFSESPGFSSRQEAETADLYLQTFFQAQATVYSPSSINHISQELHYLLFLGRKAGFAGIELFQDQFRQRRANRVKKIIKLVIKNYKDLVSKSKTSTKNKDATIADQMREMYRAATAPDRQWAKVLGLVDSQVVADDNQLRFKDNPADISDVSSLHTTTSSRPPMPRTSRHMPPKTWHPTSSTHSHVYIDGDSAHSAASFY